MPQLDILSYFSQFVFLLITFITIYYYVITFILPTTLTASKLRAKFNSSTGGSVAFQNLEKQTGTSELKDNLNTASLKLSEKSAFTFSAEDLKTLNKAGKENIRSALMLNYTGALTSKKRLISSLCNLAAF